MSKTYTEMIIDALITLDDGHKGSSRQSIWKCFRTKHPEYDSPASYKIFVTCLKKLSENPLSHISKHKKNNQRFVFDDYLRQKMRNAKKKGAEINVKFVSTAGTVKPKAIKKAQKKTQKAKAKAKDQKKKATNAKKERKSGASKGRAAAKGKSAGKGKSNKQKM
jgi:hypothetical protein